MFTPPHVCHQGSPTLHPPQCLPSHSSLLLSAWHHLLWSPLTDVSTFPSMSFITMTSFTSSSSLCPCESFPPSFLQTFIHITCSLFGLCFLYIQLVVNLSVLLFSCLNLFIFFSATLLPFLHSRTSSFHHRVSSSTFLTANQHGPVSLSDLLHSPPYSWTFSFITFTPALLVPVVTAVFAKANFVSLMKQWCYVLLVQCKWIYKYVSYVVCKKLSRETVLIQTFTFCVQLGRFSCVELDFTFTANPGGLLSGHLWIVLDYNIVTLERISCLHQA